MGNQGNGNYILESSNNVTNSGKIEKRGINYCIGMKYSSNADTRKGLDTDIMSREIEIIKNKLHSNSIRIYGEDLDKLIKCSKIAIKHGLEVWFSPRLTNASEQDTLDYIQKCSIELEKLRQENPSIVFIIGCEFTLDLYGLVKGETIYERINNLFKPITIIKNILGVDLGYNKKLNIFLNKAIIIARRNFKGQITYASGTWEKIDWNKLDIVGLNYYRSSYNSSTYRKSLKKFINAGKPVAILEFGCCSYKGSQNKGASSYNIIDWNSQRPEINGNYKRDENVQAEYIIELLKIFDEEGAFATFVFEFVDTQHIYDEVPKFDLDMASFGIIKVLPELVPNSNFTENLIPKKSYHTLANFYEKYLKSS